MKPPIEHLVDIMCVIPGLLEDAESLDLLASPSTTAISDLGDISTAKMSASIMEINVKVERYLDLLKDWKESWDKIFPNACKLVNSPLPPSDDFPVHLFGLPYEFSDLIRAKGYATYHMCLLLLFSIQSRHPQIFPYRDPSITDPITKSPALYNAVAFQSRSEAAVEICRSMPYHLRSHLHGCRGTVQVMFPVNLALAVFPTTTEEGKWIMKCLERIKDEWSLEPTWAERARRRI